MSNELIIQEDNERKKLIRETFCKGATDLEFELFSSMSKKTGLDPTMKQIYAVKRWNSSLKREEMTVQTGIDGLRLIADRTGRYAPGKEAVFTYNGKDLISATACIKKQTADGTWHDVTSTAFYDEYVQRTKEGSPSSFWKRMPHIMLAKCAEAMALRRAFPAEMCGLYIKEEMDQASNPTTFLEEPVESAESVEVSAKSVEIVEQSYDINDEQLSLVSDVSGITDHAKLKEYMSECCQKHKMPSKDAVEKWSSNPDNLVKGYNRWIEKNKAA